MNVKRNVVIAVPGTAVYMGTLLEGNCNGDKGVNTLDFLIMKASWLKAVGNPAYDARADFNRDGVVNTIDFLLMKANWLKSSPAMIL